MLGLMLTFAVFDADGKQTTGPNGFTLKHAHVSGPDDIPVASAVRVEGAYIRCDPGSHSSVGLCLQFPVEFGTHKALLMLQTCLLPEREEPYVLSVELARHRIMLFLNKLEEWDLFELAADDPVMAQFADAQQLFMRALVMDRGDDRALAQADALGRKSLALAIDAGERLALVQAQRSISLRATNRSYLDATNHYHAITGDTPAAGAPVIIPGAGHVVLSGVAAVGVAVSPGPPGSAAEPLQKFITANCDFITLPMRWVDLEPEEGEYSFAGTDRWIEWAVRSAKLPLVGGPLIDFRPTSVPEWLYIWENDYETLRELVFEHVQAVVTRYRRTIGRWYVVSGLHANNHFRLSLEQVMDLTRIAVLLVRKLQPQARIGIEIAQPWGEYYAATRKSIPPVAYAETLIQANVPFEILGLRVQLGNPAPGQTQRDLMAFSALLDRFAMLEKPIALSCVGVPAGPVGPAVIPQRAAAPMEDSVDAPPPTGLVIDPGSWISPWSDGAQAEFLQQAMAIAAGKPYVQSVCWQELIDGPPGRHASEMPGGGLFTATGMPRGSASKFGQVRQMLREGRGLGVPGARVV
jgi:hypothetical protein